MGFDYDRNFLTISNDLICKICNGIIEVPYTSSSCNHSFCQLCIQNLISVSPNKNCPVFGCQVVISQIAPANAFLQSKLNLLSLNCKNKARGCNQVLNLNVKRQHENVCPHNLQPQSIQPLINQSLPQQNDSLMQQLLQKVMSLEQEVQGLKTESQQQKAQIEYSSMQSKQVHQSVTCDGCLMQPLVGKRYKCKYCDNFDFCENCFISKSHKCRVFYQVTLASNCLGVNLLDMQIFQSQYVKVQCAGCQKSPIVGRRYRCNTCQNFEICEECFIMKQHPHNFSLVSLNNQLKN